jgi:HEAT repeat protein
MGDAKALNPLIETLGDEDWGVRMAALKALGDIGDERAVDPIKKARRAATGDKDFKKVANKALKKINKK